jgi:hypothetical protein
MRYVRMGHASMKYLCMRYVSMGHVSMRYLCMRYVSMWHVSRWMGTKVRLESHVQVVDAQVGVEGRRLRAGSAHGDSKRIEQLLQVFPAADASIKHQTHSSPSDPT